MRKWEQQPVTGEPYKKKLIEVALPLDAINREAAREKSIRHGHPSTLHLWWARRPLAACRAVLFAQLVDDPSAHPEQFPDETSQEAERLRLFGILEELVKWENVANEDVLNAARAEIARSCDGTLPVVVDPFAGGGSIPLEAQRLGLKTFGSDLNPVAVLINKALIEIPPRWTDRSPVRPDDDTTLGTTRTWRGAQGLAEDVGYYGSWLRDEAERQIGHMYPKASMPDGSEAAVIAWIWARTITCPNPTCRATMPLASSFWLGKKSGKETWVKPVVRDKAVHFEIGYGPSGPGEEAKVGRGARFRCLVCGNPAAEVYTHTEIDEGRSGQQLMAIVAAGNRQRVYLPPTTEHIVAAQMERPEDAPSAPARGTFGGNAQGQRYGFKSFADYFTNRQLWAMTTFCSLVEVARERVEVAALDAGMTSEQAAQYSRDVATYLGFAVSRVSDFCSSLTTWASNPQMEILRSTFARQAIPMTWDFAEGNVFGPSSGTIDIMLEAITRAIRLLPTTGSGRAEQISAMERDFSGVVITTDPPYYDNIGYADLADYFYVWLRQSLRGIYPELLQTMLTPKDEELVASSYRFQGDKERAKEFFENGFVDTFTHVSDQQRTDFPMTIFYAFKQSEEDSIDGQTSTGWESMLEGLRQAGLMVTGTWPVRTERLGRSVSLGTNALASSIVLVCRPRGETAGVTDRAGFLAALRAELPRELRVLQLTAIAPVDLAQASIGPGMAVFSRYAKVIEPSGEPMRVRAALGLINQVLAEVLEAVEGEVDPSTRWAVKWFEQRGFDEGPFGEAEVLATATGVAVDGLVKDGIVRSTAGRVRLVEREELPGDWDPARDDRISVWEATQHLAKALDEGGESAAASLLERLGGLGDSAQQLAYRLYSMCERKGWAKEAGPYNALAAVWGSLRSMASASAMSETVAQGTLL